MNRNASKAGLIVARMIKKAAFLTPMFTLLLSLAPRALGQTANSPRWV
jgi:hypothetical protein